MKKVSALLVINKLYTVYNYEKPISDGELSRA